MKAYKATDKDMKCRDFQYQIGEEYEEPTANLCRSGFHACGCGLDVTRYYNVADGARFFEVELDEVSTERSREVEE